MPAKNKTNASPFSVSRRHGKFDDYLFSIYILYFSADNLSTSEADFSAQNRLSRACGLKKTPAISPYSEIAGC